MPAWLKNRQILMDMKKYSDVGFLGPLVPLFLSPGDSAAVASKPDNPAEFGSISAFLKRTKIFYQD